MPELTKPLVPVTLTVPGLAMLTEAPADLVAEAKVSVPLTADTMPCPVVAVRAPTVSELAPPV